MSLLAQPITFNGLTVSNRLVRSATCAGLADKNGLATDALIDFFTELGQGGIGLIVTGHAFVREDGVASPGMLGVHDDACLPGLKRIADAVHTAGASKIVVQINHGGRRAVPDLIPDRPMAPSEVALKDGAPPPRALTTDEVKELVQAYIRAAVRVRQAGFDGVQLHAAHGYLISQFLSPLANRRTDEYGGSLENRARFVLEILDGVRAAVGPDFPVLAKLGAVDAGDGGLMPEDAARVAGWMAARSLDAVEISGGIDADSVRRRIDAPEKEGFFLEHARTVKAGVAVPVIAVGGFRSAAVMDTALASGAADMVALCRPFIREPRVAAELATGRKERVECNSCNACLLELEKWAGVRCRFAAG